MKGKVNCTCGWSWNKSDSSAKDMYICHECGRDNSNNMKNGGWLDNYGEQENYNDFKVSAPEGMIGDGFSNVGRNYSPAWGGQFEDGGLIPMAQNGRATRADSLAVYNSTIDFEKKIKDLKYNKVYDSEYTSNPVSDLYSYKNNKIIVNPNHFGVSRKINKTPNGDVYLNSNVVRTGDKKGKNTKIGHNVPVLKNLGNNKYLTTEESSFMGYNTDLPKLLMDGRIKPQNEAFYTLRDPARDSDSVKFKKYDPLAVKPFDLLTEKEKVERVKKYGNSGVPKSYLDKNKPTPNKTKKSSENISQNRKLIQAIENNLQPIGIQNDFNIEAPLPEIRQQVRQPKYYDIQENINQPFGGSQTNYQVSDLNSITSPDDLGPGNTRKIVPHYAMGGSIPGSVGFTYARTKGIPSEGPYAKKTMPSAQNGKEMQYYQQGLDFKSKSMKDGGWLDGYEKAQNGTNTDALRILDQIHKRKTAGKFITPQGKIKNEKEQVITKVDNTSSKPKVKFTDLKKTNVRNKTKAELAEQERKADEATAAKRKAVREKADTNPLNQGSGFFDSKNQTRQNWEDSTAGLESKFRVSDEPNVFDDWVNPVSWVGRMAANLGAAPNQIVQQDSMAPLVSSIAEPLLAGAIGEVASPYISKGLNVAGQLSKQGLREGVDLFHPVGKALAQIEKEGIAKGLSAQEIKKLQLEKVGITSLQREGYFPGVSEIVTEYITPYSYDNAAARIKDIPRRIIKGEKNSKNLVDVNTDFILNHEAKNLVSKPRYDAWRMYSGLPQENNTFRIAETVPMDHPSYSTEQLNNLEKFSLNNESKLLNSLPQKNDLAHLYYGDSEDLVKALPDLKAELQKIQNIKNKGVDVSPSDFTQTNVMGGYNRRFFDNKMEYNDIWDLDLKGNKVEKYFGKPFLSHGQLDYSFQPAEEELNNLIRLGEYHEKNINKYVKSPLKEFYLDTKNFNNQLNPKDLIINKKQKREGGIIKDDRGQWDHPGEITEIGSNQITMQGVPYPVLGVSDEGDVQMMYPEEKYKFKGKKVTEFPMAKNGLRQEQKGLQNLDNLINFTNYNTKQPGGWLDTL